MQQDQTPSSPSASAPSASLPAATPIAAQTEAVVAPPPGGPYTAREMYHAAQAQRRLLRDQLSNAEGQRDQVAQELRQPNVTGADREGLEHRLKTLDTRVLDLERQLADAQTREAQLAALPGSTQQSRQEVADERFEMVAVGSFMLAILVIIPLVIVQARRLWRKHSVVLSMTPELTQRLDAIDRAVEATAIEIERVGEGQRFVTQLLANRVQDVAQLPKSES